MFLYFNNHLLFIDKKKFYFNKNFKCRIFRVSEKILIGVLAYNVDKYLDSLLSSLLKLNKKIIVIDDFSNDKTTEILEKHTNDRLDFIRNEKNYGAGYSTRKLIEYAEKNNFTFLIKVDGDGQFLVEDVKKIIELRESKGYEFIKSNRFWKDGIEGNIPKKRFFGNLLATIFMQVTTGTNKLFDPLNGLFGISTRIYEMLEAKSYPKRYGYPYFITVSAIINDFRTHQINNVVIYQDQKSTLNSVKMLYTIVKLSIIFFFKKIKLKKSIGKYQRSAFLDILFISSLFISTYLLLQLIYIVYFANTSLIKPGNLLYILIFSIITCVLIFISSFKEEKAIRNTYISSE